MSGKTHKQREIRELFRQCIEIYRNEPTLWCVKSKDYHCKDKKDAAYNRLLEKYRLIEPKADRSAVVRKINSFRTNYRREKRKIEVSSRSGKVYVPRLWYYDLFNFLGDQDYIQCPTNIMNERKEKGFNYGTICIKSSPESSPVCSPVNSPINYQADAIKQEIPFSSEEIKPQPIPNYISRAISPTSNSTDKGDNVLDLMQGYFGQIKKEDDRYDLFGKNVTIKMKDISDKTQKLLAEKIINEALFMAETGQLTMSHFICNSNNEKSCVYDLPEKSEPMYEDPCPMPILFVDTINTTENNSQS